MGGGLAWASVHRDVYNARVLLGDQRALGADKWSTSYVETYAPVWREPAPEPAMPEGDGLPTFSVCGKETTFEELLQSKITERSKGGAIQEPRPRRHGDHRPGRGGAIPHVLQRQARPPRDEGAHGQVRRRRRRHHRLLRVLASRPAGVLSRAHGEDTDAGSNA